MIINIRGTNGTGKSEVVRRAVVHLGGFGRLIYEPGVRKPVYSLNSKYNLAIVGDYESQCGGADKLKFSDVPKWVIRLAQEGRQVIYESMLFSVETKQLFLIRDALTIACEPPDLRTITLSVSPEQAVKNIYARREKTGKRLGTSLDEERVKSNAARVEACRLKLIGEGVTCYRMTVDQAAAAIVRWVKASGG